MQYLSKCWRLVASILLLPTICIVALFAMMLVQIMAMFRRLYRTALGFSYLSPLISVPILGVYALHPQRTFIRPMLIINIVLCLFVFPCLIVGYDWVLNKLTGGLVERSRYFKDSPIYRNNC